MTDSTGGRSTLAGVAVLMACACATSVQTAKVAGLGGISTTTVAVHPLFVGAGALLVLFGLSRVRREPALLAAAGFLALAGAAALTPPRVMAASALPWDASQLAGAGLYVVAAVLVGLAIYRAFPTPRPEAGAMAIGGAALATGCSCCMVNGALAGTLGTAGFPDGFVHPGSALFWVGMSLAAVGAWRLGGMRAAVWIPLAAVVIRFVPGWLRATGDWEAAGIALRVFVGYGIALAGTALFLYGLASAWRAARAPAVARAREPALSAATR